MEYPACFQPNKAPKISSNAVLNRKTSCQIVLPLRFETYKATKSIPPVEAFPFKASETYKPFNTPPKITFSIVSSTNSGSKFNTRIKKLPTNTCRIE